METAVPNRWISRNPAMAPHNSRTRYCSWRVSARIDARLLLRMVAYVAGLRKRFGVASVESVNAAA